MLGAPPDPLKLSSATPVVLHASAGPPAKRVRPWVDRGHLLQQQVRATQPAECTMIIALRGVRGVYDRCKLLPVILKATSLERVSQTRRWRRRFGDPAIRSRP